MYPSNLSSRSSHNYHKLEETQEEFSQYLAKLRGCFSQRLDKFTGYFSHTETLDLFFDNASPFIFLYMNDYKTLINPVSSAPPKLFSEHALIIQWPNKMKTSIP